MYIVQCTHTQRMDFFTRGIFLERYARHILEVAPRLKMTGGTPEVRSDKSLTLLTFDF